MDIFNNPKTSLEDLLFYLASKKEIDLDTKRKSMNFVQKQDIQDTLRVYELAIQDFKKNLAFIEMIQFVYPDLFYCTVKGQSEALFEKMLKNKSENELIKMIDFFKLQKFQLGSEKDVYPKSIQVFFNYFFKFTRQPNFNRKSIEFALFVLDSLVKNSRRISHPDYKLPKIEISVFSSLLNYCFLDHPNDLEMKKVYEQTKYLLFETTHNCILTSPEIDLFKTLMGSLGGYLDLKIKVEILDVLTLLLTTRKDTAHKMCSTWVKNFENYTNESAILISHLLTYKPNILKSSVYWKKLQQTSISKAMVIMEKKTRKLIGTTKGSAKSKLIVLQREIRVLQTCKPRFGLKSLLHFFIHCVFFYFIFYALVYVQCDPTSNRTCPLPFDPQLKLQETHVFMSEKIVPLVEQGSIIAFDTFKSFVNDAYQTVKPTVEMTFKTIQESTVVTTIKDHHITDIVIKIIKNDVMRPFKTIFAAVSGIATSRLSQSEIQKLQDGGHEWHRYVNTLNEKTGDLKSLWHGFAVDMVDVYLPVTYKYVQQGWSFVRWAIEIGAKEVRKQVIGLIELVGEVSVDGWSFVQSTNVFKTMRAHQVTQTMVDYYIMNKEYVDIAMEFGAKVWGHVIGFVDFCWMVLEGRISLWDQVFVSIELAREYVEEWYATLVQ